MCFSTETEHVLSATVKTMLTWFVLFRPRNRAAIGGKESESFTMEMKTSSSSLLLRIGKCPPTEEHKLCACFHDLASNLFECQSIYSTIYFLKNKYKGAFWDSVLELLYEPDKIKQYDVLGCVLQKDSFSMWVVSVLSRGMIHPVNSDARFCCVPERFFNIIIGTIWPKCIEPDLNIVRIFWQRKNHR